MLTIRAHVILLLTVFSLSAYGQTDKKVGKTRSVYSIPFTLTDYNNLSIRTVLNRTDTVNLMFHTAANAVTLTEEAIKRLKSIRFTATTDSIKSWGGQANSARFSPENFIQIGELSWDKVPIWENVNSGQFTDGKFGIDLFNGKVVEIDFDDRLIRLYNDLPKRARKYKKTTLKAQDDLLFIAANSLIYGSNFTNDFLIHSGYSGAVLFDDQFTNAHKLNDRLTIVSEKVLKDSYGNTLKTKQAILPAFSVQDITLKNLPVGFFEGAIGRQKMSVLGGEVLKRFNLIVDAKREYIYLKPNHLTKTEYKKA